MAHALDLTTWYKHSTPPTYRGDDTQGPLAGYISVLVTDAIHTDFGSEVSTNDTIHYKPETNTTAAIVSIDAYGQVSVDGTYLAGDTFNYYVNSGTVQTFTLL